MPATSAVFMLMDAPGIREELRDMARRLATVGYYVLLPNLYYRAGRDTIYGPDVSTTPPLAMQLNALTEP
jgi:carboxymethylenebutenolidase